MHLALYRKWRPKRFDDVCGQSNVTDILRYQVATGSVSHAYLFCGLRGTGKTTCAKILAKAINCLSPENGEPCGKCELCEAADRGTLLDITEIDAASNNGVDNIRSVIEEVSFLPAQGNRKVYIVDEVHMLSGGAFNALLKTLEEPPEHVVFILCTTETHKIPATILSRCQRYDFGRIEADDIVARLEYVANKEGISLTKQAAYLIARLSDGAMRDALSLFELCVGSGGEVNYDIARALLGVPDRERLHSLCECIVSKNTSAALEKVNGMLLSTKTATVVTELLEYFRDLLIVKVSDSPERLVAETADEMERLKELSGAFEKSRLLYCMEIMENCLSSLSRPNVNTRTAVEMAAVKLCDLDKTSDVGALFARVEALERAVSGIPMPISAVEKETPKKEAPKENPQPKPAEKPAEKPKEKETEKQTEKPAPVPQKTAFLEWSEFVDAVSLEDRVARSFLGMARGFLQGDVLEVVLEDNMSYSMLLNRTSALAKAASGVVGRPMTVELKLKKTESSAGSLLD